MKRLFITLLAVAMVASGFAADYVKTDIANIKSTDEVLIVRTSGNAYAMSNDKGTSSAPSAVSVTIVDDKITYDDATNITWNITYSGGNLTIYVAGDNSKWLYCTSTNNGVRIGTNANKVFTLDGTYLKNTATSRFVGVYSNQDWRCYTSKSSSSNIASQTFAFFVKQASAPSYTITASSNNEILGTVSVSGNEITATPAACVSYASPAYKVTSGTATVSQSGNTFTVTASSDCNVQINFAESVKDTYIDKVHGTDMTGDYCGSYDAPTIADKTKVSASEQTGVCDHDHYHFVGWVATGITGSQENEPDGLIKAGSAMTASGKTYYAVWAQEK